MVVCEKSGLVGLVGPKIKRAGVIRLKEEGGSGNWCHSEEEEEDQKKYFLEVEILWAVHIYALDKHSI